MQLINDLKNTIREEIGIIQRHQHLATGEELSRALHNQARIIYDLLNSDESICIASNASGATYQRIKALRTSLLIKAKGYISAADLITKLVYVDLLEKWFDQKED